MIITDILLGGDGHTKVSITDVIAPLYLDILVHRKKCVERIHASTSTRFSLMDIVHYYIIKGNYGFQKVLSLIFIYI